MCKIADLLQPFDRPRISWLPLHERILVTKATCSEVYLRSKFILAGFRPSSAVATTAVNNAYGLDIKS